MSFFDRFKRQTPPGWASLSRRQQAQFLDDVHAALTELGMTWTDKIEEGGIDLENGMQIGLANLSRMWKQVPSQSRKNEVIRFLQIVSNPRPSSDEVPWDEAKDRLRIRIYLEADLHSASVALVKRRLCDTLCAVVMLDDELSAATVNTDALEKWEITSDELLQIAQENTIRHESVEVLRVNDQQGIAMTVVQSESIYAASHALDLDRYLIPTCPTGAFVMIPNRHTFLFLPAVQETIREPLGAMLKSGLGLYNEGTGPISPCLYWWDNGDWVQFGTPTSEGYEVKFPDKFKAMIDGQTSEQNEAGDIPPRF